MVLYTPCDIQAVMSDHVRRAPALREVALSNGLILLGRDVEEGFMIERVISGNANAYLLACYQPGKVVKLP